jgi:integrase
VRRFVEFVGDLEPGAVTRDQVVAYRDGLESLPRMKSANIAEYLCKIHVLFNLALSEGIVSTNPAHGIRVRDFGTRQSTGRQSFMSSQVREIFDALNTETEVFGSVVPLLGYHGMRSGEVWQPRCADVTTLHGVPVLRVHDLRTREESSEHS